jgi:RES domain-containing protein
MSPESCWAELIRHENLRTEADLDLVRMPFWVCRVSSMLIFDFTDRQMRDDHEITEDALVGDDYGPCQDLGASVRALGASVRARSRAMGVIAPSAALPGHRNLTLFGPRRPIMWGTQPALASAIPTTQAALGRPPEGLLEHVRRLLPDQPAGRLF